MLLGWLGFGCFVIYCVVLNVFVGLPLVRLLYLLFVAWVGWFDFYLVL